MEERFQDAAFLRDNAGTGLVSQPFFVNLERKKRIFL